MVMKRVLAWILFLILLTVPFGCGKKAPPFLPKQDFSFHVEGLKALRQGNQIQLTGKVATPQGSLEGLADVASCRVYHVRYPVESPPCEGCPIAFGTYREIRPHISALGVLQCAMDLKPTPGIHYFLVRLVDREGTVGPPSNRAKLLEE